MSTKENEMITPQDFEEVGAYVKENYQLSSLKRIMTYSTAARPFECPEGFTASIRCFQYIKDTKKKANHNESTTGTTSH